MIVLRQQILPALASGVLLFAAWPVSPFTLLIFIAWIPLLWLESRIKGKKRFFALSYITMFTWNVSTTWWIWNASPPGAVGAFLANSLIMCLPWLGYKIARQKLGDTWGYAALIAFWMCFEYIHLLDWGLSWPWLTLGNVFASNPQWIQWYEFTGTSGGTFWVLLVNIILYMYLKSNIQTGTRNYRYAFSGIAALVIPILLSTFAFNRKETTSPANIVVVQPNIDPYEKVSEEAGSFEAQMQKLIALSEKQVDDQTALVVWPETALYSSSRIDELHLKENFFLNPVWNFLKRHPRASLFTGIESFRVLDVPSKNSREYNGDHYEFYNGSVILDSTGAKGFYHKSMLVPGVETLPWFLKFIDKWFEKFGGTSAGYAKQDERTVLESNGDYRIAPSICYESIYGEFMSRYARNGANIIAIITNDGWWDNTPGHRQHMNYARLRAIENRRWVVRSANTGISCFIDPYGRAIYPLPYNTEGAIKYPVPALGELTFFSRNGDLLSRVMIVFSLVFAVWITIKKFRTTRSRNTK